MGRYALTEGLNLPAAGLVAEKNGKFKVNDVEQTNIPHIYAVGDVQYGQLELQPVASRVGTMIANRLFLNHTAKMDYDLIPTTVFTPLEYGCCGPTEEEAKEKYGADIIRTYHTEFQPLEWQYNKERAGGDCYVKVLVNTTNDKVVGFHILAPNAGEMTQGLAVAMKCGMTKEQLDSTVGIHPTAAEDVIGLQYTKEEHGDVQKSSC